MKVHGGHQCKRVGALGQWAKVAHSSVVINHALDQLPVDQEEAQAIPLGHGPQEHLGVRGTQDLSLALAVLVAEAVRLLVVDKRGVATQQRQRVQTRQGDSRRGRSASPTHVLPVTCMSNRESIGQRDLTQTSKLPQEGRRPWDPSNSLKDIGIPMISYTPLPARNMMGSDGRDCTTPRTVGIELTGNRQSTSVEKVNCKG